MGLFGSIAESRVRQILRKELGQEIPIDFIADGRLSFIHWSFSINPFYAAINNDGVFFIQDAKVVLILPWNKILVCNDLYPVLDQLELVVQIEEISQTAQPKEYPYCYWHKSTIIFSNRELKLLFLQKFKEVKLNTGFTSESLELFTQWVSFEQNLPVSKADFIQLNSDFGDEEKILKLYFAWGKANDALHLLFSTARRVCEGITPGWILPMALKMSELWTQEYLDLVGQTWETGSDLQRRIDATSKIPFKVYSDKRDQWAIGALSMREMDWDSELYGIPVAERLTLINLQEHVDGKQNFLIWNDLVYGARAFVVEGLEFVGNDGSLNIGTTQGMIRILPDHIKLLPGLSVKLENEPSGE
jgi:hypothetical protein